MFTSKSSARDCGEPRTISNTPAAETHTCKPNTEKQKIQSGGFSIVKIHHTRVRPRGGGHFEKKKPNKKQLNAVNAQLSYCSVTEELLTLKQHTVLTSIHASQQRHFLLQAF